MKIFLDTAHYDDIALWWPTGLVDGVTTNPSLLAAISQDPVEVLTRISSLVTGPISVEVTCQDVEGMLRQGRFLASLASHMVIKLPLTVEGLQACGTLSKEGISVNMTLCFSLGQAMLAAKAGATYVSIFVGRLEDTGVCGPSLLQDVRRYYDDYPHGTTQILAASLRSVPQALQAIQSGAHAMTLPPKVFAQLLQHPLTTQGLEIFQKDWHAAAVDFPESLGG